MQRYLSLLGIALCSSGCGTALPNLVDERVLPLEELVANIDCEFQDAVRTQIYRNKRSWLTSWQGQYTITLKGNETGGVKIASATAPILVSRQANLNLGIGGGATTTANRTAILKFNLDFATVKDGPPCIPVRPVSGHPMLAGKIGFEEWMNRAFAGALTDQAISSRTGSIASVGHTFQFTLDLTASTSPSFTIVPTPATTITPTGTIERFEDNIVDVSVGKAAGATDSVSKTVSKYDADQLKIMSELKEAIKDLTEKIRDGDKRLAALAPMLAQARELEQYTQPTIMNNIPDDRKAAVEDKRREAFKFFADNGLAIQQARDLDVAIKAQRRDLVTTKGQLIDTLNHPTEQTTVRREVRAASPLNADQNPNVTNIRSCS